MRNFLTQGTNNDPINGVPAGTLAVYESGVDGTDHAPAQNPRANLARVAFHSDLDYLGVVSETVKFLTLPATSAGGGLASGDVVLFAHGQGAKPLLMAQFSYDQVTWYAVNGSTYTTFGAAATHRGFHVQADATNVYCRWSTIGNRVGLGVYIRVQILSRTYNAPKPSPSEIFSYENDRLRANGGLFDTARKYLQAPAAGQIATTNHTSGQTLGIFDGDAQGEINFALANGSLHGNAAQSIAFAAPAAPLLGKVEVPLVFAGPGGAPNLLELSSAKMQVANASGTQLLDTSRKMLAITDEFRGAFGIVAHGAAPYTTEVPHQVIHATKNITAGASVILGWLEITGVGGGAYLANNRPLEFSGSILLWANGVNFSGTFWCRNWLQISPRISGGQLQVVEHYYNQSTQGNPDQNTPSITGTFHLFAAALVGGF